MHETRFSSSSNRRFRESKGSAGTLVMKIPVEIVYLVTRAEKCYKASQGLITAFSKKCQSKPFFENLCLKPVFLLLQLDLLEGVRVVWVLWLLKKLLKLCT